VRVPIPDDIAAEVMFRHHRICCVCNIPGKAVQIHHIDDNPANNDPANLAVLCLECHNDTQVAGGFGRKLRASEVIKHRDDWIQRVKERKTEVDRILVARMADVIKVEGVLNKPWEPPSGKALLALINSLPDTLRYVYEQARPDWDSGVRSRMMGGTSLVLDVLEQTWIRLAAWYPPNHFGDRPADRYFGEYVMQRHIWNAALGETDGRGTAGRDAGIISAGDTMLDAENAIVDTVRWLATSRLDDFDFDAWLARWDAVNKE
jgi:hypothetical protein